MVETGRSGISQTAANTESQIKTGYVIAGKPLDFSFLKIQNVARKSSTTPVTRMLTPYHDYSPEEHSW